MRGMIINMQEETDLWDILKMKKKIKRLLIEKDLFILEIKEKLIKMVLCILQEELKS